MSEIDFSEASRVVAVPPKPWDAASSGRVIFVEDDDVYRETLDAELQQRCFDVRSFADATGLLAQPSLATQADILLLDWTMPVMSGIELLSHLRRSAPRVPVVFLTGRALTANEHIAFDQGAADFIDKSRGVDVLVRRLARLIDRNRNGGMYSEPPQRIGELTVRPRIARASWRGRELGLTFCEFNVVNLLSSHAGQWVTYRAIYDCVHYAGFIAGTGEDGYRGNVRSIIKRIRNKFRLIDAEFGAITNHDGIGYRWEPGSESS
jgi:two-component system, OmpR family, response regulator ChvI